MELPIAGLHGAYRRRDLAEAGGRRITENALRRGLLRPLWTGIVVDTARYLDPLTRSAAGLLATGGDSVLVDETAAHLHGCRSVDVAVTHVRIPYGREFRSRPGLAVHHGGFLAHDVLVVDGLRVLPLDRVVADLLCRPNGSDGLAVADEALRLARPHSDRFRRAVAERLSCRVDPRGTVRGAVLLDLASPDAESPPESWLRFRIVEKGFPLPEVNWPLSRPDGREIFRVDLAWPSLRIALEYDGYESHADREEEDAARQRELERRGWIVVRVRKEDLRDLSRVCAELRSAFDRRGYTW